MSFILELYCIVLLVYVNVYANIFWQHVITNITQGREEMKDLSSTQYFKVPEEKTYNAAEVLKLVYSALQEKGYNPVNQIVGYIMSGDPTYITSHMNARSLIRKVERDELIEETVKYYIDNKLSGQ